jgi:hypothetical protein
MIWSASALERWFSGWCWCVSLHNTVGKSAKSNLHEKLIITFFKSRLKGDERGQVIA